MRLEDLNWMDVERYLEQDDRLILILGACEQHAYLSLLTDIKIPLALADYTASFDDFEISPVLKRAIVVYNGELTPDYRYLQQYLRGV